MRIRGMYIRIGVSLTPVDLRVATLGQDFLDDLGVHDLCQVLLDEGEPLLGLGAFRHVDIGISEVMIIEIEKR